jgi:hypothetical protein
MVGLYLSILSINESVGRIDVSDAFEGMGLPPLTLVRLCERKLRQIK